ncbi:glycoside hydrolase family 20 zincin-like fold domain-containing protein [Phycisphaera mikurensis]|uniref:Putative glycoside hydrolase n=1 Tax=Phycisphaera mikurensis (strain NBRC 102666 / KCTC 22515 / FYK2301M01) TaxID=1142394 RepID=I0IIX4_PHYMF|nr:glycoside hydrolase family 20 zincin-like fold domain-containing protein [Phycisphaera mikurensis]MBB6443403.1 hypothetical protein [Phycisphaera mikurensis]BAM05212.1 putative glycoside hydrolase [Phycisphaera mikurensis NBRC 102666]
MLNLPDLFLFPAPQSVTAAEGTAAADAPVSERVDPADRGRKESFRLTVRGDGVDLVAHDEAGLFYGREALRQLRLGAPQRLPCGEIVDHPDLAVRGYMLDCSRDRVPSMAFLRDTLIPRLGRLRVNHLELYTEHTIRYAGHEPAWKDASPFTFEELGEIQRLCREHFIELVPCQNLFGHMERWLDLPAYHHLAEVDEGFESPWGWRPGTCSLAPVLPEAFELSADLIDQLCAASDATLFNIGCDETFDLGQGKSKEACEREGKAHVYLGYLKRLCARVSERGKTPIYFGDIVLNHPELIAELPPEGVLVNWNYESIKSFAPESERFQQAGVRFYVCPGTSSWCSLTGRGRNATDNQRDAAEAGIRFGAEGYLNTEWGDHGHWQTQAVSWVGLVFGSGVAWCLRTNGDTDALPRAISRVAADEEDPGLGAILWDLANAYESSDARWHNATWWFRFLHAPELPIAEEPLARLSTADTDAGEAALDAVLGRLGSVETRTEEAALLVREAAFSAALARWSCRRAGERLRGGDAGAGPAMRAELEGLAAEHRALWAIRSRPGGLEDSVRKLEKPLRVTGADAGAVRTSGNF